jgi:hypothetical protein
MDLDAALRSGAGFSLRQAIGSPLIASYGNPRQPAGLNGRRIAPKYCRWTAFLIVPWRR